jgi:hypothetical protein
VEEQQEIEDEVQIANHYNKFFVEKFFLLKAGIDQKYVKEPLTKLRKKMEQKQIKFSLKTVSEKTVYKAMCSLKKKKNAGVDGISQEQLVLGTKVLVVPLTRIINNSITNGEFPEMWKDISNYNIKERRSNQETILQTCQVFVSSIKSVGKNNM